MRHWRTIPLATAVTVLVMVFPASAADYGKASVEPKSYYWIGADYLWLRTSERNYSAFFGKNTHLGRIHGGWKLFPLVDGMLSAGFGRPSANTWATKQPDGIPVGAPGSNPTVRTLNVEKLYLIPVEASVRVRGQFVRDQLLVPYAEGGFTSWVFHDDFGQTGLGSVTGVKNGLFGGGGLMLDVIDLDAKAKRSLRSSGIQNVYFLGAAQYAWVNNFGRSGLDLSGWRFNFGLELRMKN